MEKQCSKQEHQHSAGARTIERPAAVVVRALHLCQETKK